VHVMDALIGRLSAADRESLEARRLAVFDAASAAKRKALDKAARAGDGGGKGCKGMSLSRCHLQHALKQQAGDRKTAGKRYATSLRHLRAALRHNPSSFAALQHLGGALLRGGELLDAGATFLHALRLDAAQGEAQRALVAEAERLGVPQTVDDPACADARDVVDPACVNTPGHPEWHCDKWAKEGECDKNKPFMHAQCKRSCGLCKRVPPPCAAWKREGKCGGGGAGAHPRGAAPPPEAAHCRKTCGRCAQVRNPAADPALAGLRPSAEAAEALKKKRQRAPRLAKIRESFSSVVTAARAHADGARAAARGDHAGALRHANAVLKQVGDASPRHLLARARAHFALLNFPEAVRDASGVLKVTSHGHAQHADAVALGARASLEIGEPGAALSMARHGLKSDPDNRALKALYRPARQLDKRLKAADAAIDAGRWAAADQELAALMKELDKIAQKASAAAKKHAREVAEAQAEGYAPPALDGGAPFIFETNLFRSNVVGKQCTCASRRRRHEEAIDLCTSVFDLRNTTTVYGMPRQSGNQTSGLIKLDRLDPATFDDALRARADAFLADEDFEGALEDYQRILDRIPEEAENRVKEIEGIIKRTKRRKDRHRPNPLAVLQLPNNGRFTCKQLRRAYRKASLKWHPDKNPRGKAARASRKFSRATDARNLLSEQRNCGFH